MAANDSKTLEVNSPLASKLPPASDADGDKISYTLHSQAKNGKATINADGSYSYTPNSGYQGDDSFSYSVNDGKGGSNIYNIALTVKAANVAPTGSDGFYFLEEDVALNNTLPLAQDVNGDRIVYSLAQQASAGTATVRSDGSFTYTPAANSNGVDSFTYTISDGNGGSNTYTANLYVVPVNDAPTASDVSATLDEDTGVRAQLPTYTDHDPFDVIKYSIVTEPEHGSAIVYPDGRYYYYPNPDYHGVDSFTYAVDDGQGGRNVYTINLTINSIEDAPVTSHDYKTLDEDTQLTSKVPTAREPEGDPVTYSLSTKPLNGSLKMTADGSYTYVPNANFYGSDSFTYIASDDKGNSNTATIHLYINPVNDAPIASNTTISINEDESSVGYLPTATDADGDYVTYSLTTAPSNGAATISSYGYYQYSPNLDYHGKDSFTYTVNDSYGGSNTYTVSVTVNPVNDAPIADDLYQSLDEDTVLEGRLPAATDAEGDVITYSLAFPAMNGVAAVKADGSYTYTPNANYHGYDHFAYSVDDGQGGISTYYVNLEINSINDIPTAADAAIALDEDTWFAGYLPPFNDEDALPFEVTYALGTQASHGTAWVSDLGYYEYTPNPDYNGNDNFTYTVNDSYGGSNTYTVSVTVNPVNDAPIADNLYQSLDEDTVLDGKLPAATDVEGDTITYTLASPAMNGVATVSADGSYSYTPYANYHGQDYFVYSVDDGQGGVNTYSVHLEINSINDIPTAADTAIALDENSLFYGNLPPINDEDGLAFDWVTYALGIQASHGIATVNELGYYEYTPNPDYHGNDSFTYTVNDSYGGSNTYTVSVTVNPVNDAPIADDLYQSLDEDTVLEGKLPAATDADGDAITYVLAFPAIYGMTTVNTDGSYSYTPDANYYGSDYFGYSVDDGQGGISTYSVSLSINPLNDAPTSSSDVQSVDQNGYLHGYLPPVEDIDSASPIYSIVNQPGNGVASIYYDGSFSYIPNSGFQGIDSFDFMVTDEQGAKNTYTLTIHVNNSDGSYNYAPETSYARELVMHNTPLESSIKNVSDRNGDTLTYKLDKQPYWGGHVELNMDGSYTFTPELGQQGFHSFTFIVSDGRGGNTKGHIEFYIEPAPTLPISYSNLLSTSVTNEASFNNNTSYVNSSEHSTIIQSTIPYSEAQATTLILI
ncbi:Ig-like domain-containing protein [Brachymonas sp. G13]|uniref:tandem-95 repeat protein n=1 Tax=Brachymonas wangyanguii TaxID=3130163 RepID=UPI00307E7635